ncbi:MAG: hypothetical protein IKW79_04440, partial [Schwartzia sp.]|nr:hypothetical protein [Schwartzia sp. (in: firmicutes)]
MFKQLHLTELKQGMVLAQPLVSRQGSLVVDAGTLLTDFVIEMLQDPTYMEEILPKGIGFTEMTLNVFVAEQHGALSVEDLSHVGPAVKKTDEHIPPNPHNDTLLDPEYVATYDAVMEMLQKLLSRESVEKGLDLDAIG